MYKHQHRGFHKILSHRQSEMQGDRQYKLENIIKAFRQNNVKLMQTIEDCEKKRDSKKRITTKRLSDKYFLEKNEHQKINVMIIMLENGQSAITMQTQRSIENPPYNLYTKNNIATIRQSKTPLQRNENCEEIQTTSAERRQLKLVKINLKKLLPLSIDQLKYKIRML